MALTALHAYALMLSTEDITNIIVQIWLGLSEDSIDSIMCMWLNAIFWR